MDAARRWSLRAPRAVRATVASMVGKRCWRKEIGEHRSLSLGFGCEVHRKTSFGERVYGEWEAGTYSASWRVLRGGEVVCGSGDEIEGRVSVNHVLAAIEFGELLSIAVPPGVVRLRFETGVVVEFFRVRSDSSEWFHVFCPANVFVELRGRGSWTVGPSNKPWLQSTAEGRPSGAGTQAGGARR